MKQANRSGIIAAATFMLLLSMIASAPAQESIYINLETPESPWTDVRLGEKLQLQISGLNHPPVIMASTELKNSLGWRSRQADFAELMALGQNLGAACLIDIFIDRVDIETRKITVIPQAAFRYQVYGVLQGTLRLVDIKRGRLLKIEEINFELKAVDRWRFGDDDITDGDLRLSPYDKVLLIRKVEDLAAKKLGDEIKTLSRGMGNFGAEKAGL